MIFRALPNFRIVALVAVSLLLTLGLTSYPAAAQFNIKLPKLPKVEKEKPQQPTNAPGDVSPGSNPTVEQPSMSRGQASRSSSSDGPKFQEPRPSSAPVFLKDTLEISLATRGEYWKFPKERYHSNWIPKVVFQLFYDQSERSRYTAEWFKPDGSLWYSESLETGIDGGRTQQLKSPYNGDLFDTASTDQTGLYGLKITNSKTKEVIFQGKFNVRKSIDTPGDPVMKNAYQFFVDNDWHLVTGYAGIWPSSWSHLELQPEVLLWFKGEHDPKDFEARLFFNGQQITSTDDGGRITDEAKRSEDCVRGQEVCKYVLYSFRWDKFLTEQASYMRGKYTSALFSQDKPGEYTIKVYLKGVQVREAKFTIGPDGLVAKNPYSTNLYPSLTLIPVKVMGNAEKWDATSWKNSMFYGNPIAGFGPQ